MDKTLDDSLVGQVLDGRYRVDSLIARGGMATVYLATDRRLDRVVALKVMHPELARHEEFVSRFIREAKTAARLTHPNIVAVFDQSADGGHVYLVMEFIDGQTLRELLGDRGRCTPREALELLGPVLSALGAAHRAGMVHRDVKPENVLIGKEGTYAHAVKVADFGLARSAAAGATVSLAGMIVGTASYLAPEQVKSGICDARSDVYSAGIVLYEMLTGAKPFVADSPIQVAYRHVHDEVPTPSASVPGLDPALDALVARATAKDPAERPADANVFHAEVMRTAGSLPDAALDFGAIPEEEDPDNTATAEFAAMSGQRHFARTRMMPAPETTRAVPPPPPLPADATRVDPAARATKPGGKQVYKARTSPNQPRQLVPADQPWRPRRGHYALAVILVVALILGIAAWWAASGQFRSMPSVIRQTQQAAIAQLTRDGLHADVLSDYSDSVPSGLVITSSPDPSGKVKKGGEVRITVSKGPKPVAVPDEAGQDPDTAAKALRDAGFQVVIATDQVFSDSVASGAVVSVNPGFAQPGATLTLTLSKGAQAFPVPDVTGLSEDDARAKLAAAGFTNVKVNKWFFGDTVHSQQPEAGKDARHADPVELFENPLS
ncbi:serine/threonine protein kinase with PASTA sensor(s) [Catenulispora acidiphila DSM 44928]|uniref:non-specific serine/threonine protein kinase n=1 Tax=Catenulispora acidiphila (strain DSM 44928 / JCM 14897 / NBRC 102108 / NRRL B-24433 / ID139908) TaxID=479433 RepID=C7QGH9_CATAD|nr:Stk1 family PASTA domain-containing Ser/Thr kinase [Catenulispora acidiphila]ACU74859.1 serine/threonine protein kinase with PASTA sensor(s) [Catenulispora acidiphila DSM 44928]